MNDTVGLRVVWSCFCEWTRIPADTDLVDRVTSAGIQSLVGEGGQGLWWLPVCFLLLIHHISCVCYPIYSQARMWIDCLVSLFIQTVILVFFCSTSRPSCFTESADEHWDRALKIVSSWFVWLRLFWLLFGFKRFTYCELYLHWHLNYVWNKLCPAMLQICQCSHSWLN